MKLFHSYQLKFPVSESVYLDIFGLVAIPGVIDAEYGETEYQFVAVPTGELSCPNTSPIFYQGYLWRL